MSSIVRLGSVRRAGRFSPRRASGLRGGVVVLRPGETMPWHSTKSREELLIVLAGWLRVDIGRPRGRPRAIRLNSGGCLLLPCHTMHEVVNRSTKPARYLYVTAPSA